MACKIYKTNDKLSFKPCNKYLGLSPPDLSTNPKKKRVRKKTKIAPKVEPNIHNLSNHKLTYYENKILEKGLNYVVTNNRSNFVEKNLKYVDKLQRKMKLKQYFKIQNNLFRNSGNKNLGKPKIPYISIPSAWSPPEDYIEIDDFCNKLKFGIKNINNKYKNTPDLCKNEFKALLNLRNNKNIVIKSADKGGGTVVINIYNY